MPSSAPKKHRGADGRLARSRSGRIALRTIAAVSVLSAIIYILTAQASLFGVKEEGWASTKHLHGSGKRIIRFGSKGVTQGVTHKDGADPGQRLTSSSAPVHEHPLWWWAPFWTGDGYGTEAISYVMGLIRAGLARQADLMVTQSGNVIDYDLVSTVNADVKEALHSMDPGWRVGFNGRKPPLRPSIVVCHSFPMCWAMENITTMQSPGCPCPPKNIDIAYRVGRTMFEIDRVPEYFVKACASMDEVWVPSQFNVDTFAASGVPRDMLHVLPEGIDTTVWDPHRSRPLNLSTLKPVRVAGPKCGACMTGRHTFLSVFKWEPRKGWDVLLGAWADEFGSADDVQLLIVTYMFTKGDSVRTQAAKWLRQNRPDKPLSSIAPILLLTQYIPESDFPGLYLSADALVIPTRGEGWGRPQMEAMAMGRPIITTNWSGTTAFTNNKVAYLIEVEELVPTADSGPDAGQAFLDAAGSRWAQPRATHLRQLMRQVVTHPREAAAVGAAARRHIQEHFTERHAAAALAAHWDRIERKLAATAAASSG